MDPGRCHSRCLSKSMQFCSPSSQFVDGCCFTTPPVESACCSNYIPCIPSAAKPSWALFPPFPRKFCDCRPPLNKDECPICNHSLTKSNTKMMIECEISKMQIVPHCSLNRIDDKEPNVQSWNSELNYTNCCCLNGDSLNYLTDGNSSSEVCGCENGKRTYCIASTSSFFFNACNDDEEDDVSDFSNYSERSCYEYKENILYHKKHLYEVRSCESYTSMPVGTEIQNKFVYSMESQLPKSIKDNSSCRIFVQDKICRKCQLTKEESIPRSLAEKCEQPKETNASADDSCKCNEEKSTMKMEDAEKSGTKMKTCMKKILILYEAPPATELNKSLKSDKENAWKICTKCRKIRPSKEYRAILKRLTESQTNCKN